MTTPTLKPCPNPKCNRKYKPWIDCFSSEPLEYCGCCDDCGLNGPRANTQVEAAALWNSIEMGVNAELVEELRHLVENVKSSEYTSMKRARAVIAKYEGGDVSSNTIPPADPKTGETEFKWGQSE